MTVRRVLEVSITVESPFLFGATANERLGLDAVAMRDTLGHAIIPDTQIKGVLLAACRVLARHSDVITDHEIIEAFGTASSEEQGFNAPEPGTVLFSDLTGPKPEGHFTTRIEIDDDTGTVKSGSLQVVELVAPFGDAATFNGAIVLRGEPSKLDRLQNAICKALALIPAIGGFKSHGFGRIAKVPTVIRTRETFLVPGEVENLPERIVVDLTLDSPLLVDSRRLADNVFISSKVIPGAALKGAIARRLRLAGAMDDEAVSELTISHAWPLSQESVACERPLPEAAQISQDCTLLDALKVPPNTPRVAADGTVAPFVNDAKYPVRNAMRSHLQRPEFYGAVQMRTNVAINDKTSSAEDGKIHSSVRVGEVDERGQPVTWRFQVDLGQVENIQYRAKLAGLFAEGETIDGLGRGRSIGTIAACKAIAPPGCAAREVTLILETDAFLTDPEQDGQDDILKAHETYFEQLDGLSLVNLTARRHLAGGYAAMRGKAFGAGNYFPFIMTTAGACFQVNVNDDKGVATLNDILRHGLPATKVNGKTQTWRDCLYQRENGYGAVSILDDFEGDVLEVTES